MHSIDFHAHPSPQGAYATFTCGRFGKGGGATIEGTRPAEHDLVVGFTDESGNVLALPFFRGSGEAELASFAEEASAPGARPARRIALGDVTREYARGTDTWRAGDLTFTLFTPVACIPDPDALDALEAGEARDAGGAELAAALLPAIVARVRLDNRAQTSARRIVFAVDPGRACRLLEDAPDGTLGVGWGREIGFCAPKAAGLRAFVEVSELDFFAHRRSHALGSTCGLVLDVPPGEGG